MKLENLKRANEIAEEIRRYETWLADIINAESFTIRVQNQLYWNILPALNSVSSDETFKGECWAFIDSIRLKILTIIEQLKAELETL